jgi:hypothetical protein
MRGLLCGLSSLVTLGLLVAALAADDQKDAASADNRPAGKVVSVGKVVGKLTKVEGEQGITLEVTQESLQVNGRAHRGAAPTYRLKESKKTVTLPLTEGVKIRTLKLPPKFDAQGKPQQYTKEELADLKGSDRKLPGYRAEFESLKAGEIVRVELARRKGGKEAAAADADKAKDKKAAKADKPVVTLIVILKANEK